jgi:carbonic anhydrase
MAYIMRLITCYLLSVLSVVVAFEYENDGPSKWFLTYPECGGNRQSPINIRTSQIEVEPAEFLRLYQPLSTVSTLPFVNNGHTLMLNVTTRNMWLAGSVFLDLMQVIQLHYHTPSEHTIDGKQFDMEMHFYSYSINHQLFGDRYPMVIISFLYQISDYEDILLKQLMPYLTNLTTLNTVNIVFNPLFEDLGPEFYEYDGSTTTPPCIEMAHWLISTEIRNATKQQIGNFSAIMGNNNRPVQNINGRRVYKRPSASYDLSMYTSCSLSSSTCNSSPVTSTVLNFGGLFQGAGCVSTTSP